MNPETIEKLKAVFAPVAEKIGQGAEFGYSVVLRQQYVEGVLGLFAAIIGIVVLVIVWKWAFPNIWAERTGNGDAEIPAIMTAILGTVGGSASIIVGSITAITHFLNPHFYTIKFFMDLVK